MAGWHVTVNDIKNWTATNKRRSEEILPLLVKKLICASCKPKDINFPSGDSIATGGWDGFLEVETGNRFIPAGKSGWECGTSKNVKRKADDDYNKRSEDLSPFELKETTFVFVTFNQWTKYHDWVFSRQKDKKWKDVKGVNAEILKDWILECPAVHSWFLELIGKRSSDTWDIKQAWKAFACGTAVHLQSEFFLYNRNSEIDSLKNLLRGSSDSYRIKAQSQKEAYGFLLSVIRDDDVFNSRCLIIKTQQAWDLMVQGQQPLILIPKGFLPSGIGGAVNNRHIVLLPVDNQDLKDSSIILSRHSRLIRQESIQKLGFDKEKSFRIYQETKGYIEPILRHKLMKPIDGIVPSWPKKVSVDISYALFFATEWREDNRHDKKVLELLSNMPYQKFKDIINKLAKMPDPPIRKIGDVWQVISKIDLWFLISHLIEDNHLDRLKKACFCVIPNIDPFYDLLSEEEFMANIKKAIPRYSKELKRGLADSMAMVSECGDDCVERLSGDAPSLLVNYWVKNIFAKNNSTRFWYSMNTVIPFIAEAAPEAFLEAVERDSLGDDSPLLGLFQSEGSSFMGGCYHSGLLWALELISWNSEYLPKVSLCLARLSEIDPGGNFSNRPFNSLVNIYLGWINNTSATHEQRIQIFKNVLIPRHSEISWRLMPKVRSNNSGRTSGVNKPEYREWSNNVSKVNNKTYCEYIQSIVGLLFQEVEKNFEKRVVDLINKFDSFTPKQEGIIITRMLSVDVGKICKEDRINILDKIRNILSNHRQCPNTKWVWSNVRLNRLEKVYNHFEFDDVVEVNIFLFDDHWPKLIESISEKKISYEERQELVSQKRISAFESIYSTRGVKGLENLISNCSFPYLVGTTAFRSSLSGDIQKIALKWLGQNGSKEKFSEGFVSELACSDFDKAENIIRKNNRWTSIKKAKFLLCMRFNSKILDMANTLQPKGKEIFWSSLNYYFTSDHSVEMVSQITKCFLEYNNPLSALDSLGQIIDRGNSHNLDSGLVLTVLIKVVPELTDIKDSYMQHAQDNILKAIQFLQNMSELPEEEIRQIEWLYLRFFELDEFFPRYLIRNVINNPKFFVQLICWLLKRDDDKEETKGLTEEQAKRRAETSWKLLESLSILPGQQGGKIDEKVLSEWIDVVREELKKCSRLEVGDQRIGEYLSRSPCGEDGIWPHESVRTVIERLESVDVDKSIQIGLRNARGMTSRDIYDGGEQERVLAKKYLDYAELMQFTIPRTAAILRSIAKNYEWEAVSEDREVELRS